MHFNLAPFLALIPIVAGMALPAPSTDAQALSDLASYEVHTMADGATCLAIAWYYDRYYGPGNAGVPGCGTQRLNRVSFESPSLFPSFIPPLSLLCISTDLGRKVAEKEVVG